MNPSDDFEDDFYESVDFDLINSEEKQPSPKETHSNKKNLMKKKRQLEDWLEEKRLRDQLREEP